MKMTKGEILAEAIRIRGYLPINTAQGELRVYTIRKIEGKWATTSALSSDLRSYRRFAVADLIATAQHIIAHSDEITAERERAMAAMMMS